MKQILMALTVFLVSAANAGQNIEDLAELLEGRFDAHAADATLPAAERMVTEYVRLDAPELGNYVFYQQINHREELSVYRQRILILRESAGGSIEQIAYVLLEPERFVDAAAESVDELGVTDIQAFMTAGCEQLWTRSATGFRGYVDPDRCIIVSSRTGRERRIESEIELNATSISLAERGYDADTREQLFGTPQGEFLLLQRLP